MEDGLFEFFTRLPNCTSIVRWDRKSHLPSHLTRTISERGILLRKGELDIFGPVVGAAWSPSSLYLRKQAGFLGSKRNRISKLEGHLLFIFLNIIKAAKTLDNNKKNLINKSIDKTL